MHVRWCAVIAWLRRRVRELEAAAAGTGTRVTVSVRGCLCVPPAGHCLTRGCGAVPAKGASGTHKGLFSLAAHAQASGYEANAKSRAGARLYSCWG